MAPLGDLISTGDALKEFGIPAQTLRRWATDRKVRHVRTPGGVYLFYREDLEALFTPIEPETAERSQAS